MKQVTVYELGDKLEVTAKPSTGNVAVGTVLTVVEHVPNYKWIDQTSVQQFYLNKNETYGYEFKLYEPPIMQNSEFEVGQVVKCVSIEGYGYELGFQVGEQYTVGVDSFGDTGPLGKEGHTLRPEEENVKFILITPTPLTQEPESALEIALQLEVERLTTLVSKLTDEVLQLRGVIGKVEDILSEA